jgi:predicted transglutaminase-like cysteine proteinase
MTCTFACSLMMVPHIPSAQAVGIFGFKEYAHYDLKPFPKWKNVLDTYKDTPGDCDNGQLNACAYAKWEELVEELKGKPKKYQLERVNTYINLHRYILDPINWGVKDYWEIPKEFFARFGDCEDYAIVKYFTLRSLGWKAEDMKIVVLQDLNLRIAHAVLAVQFDKKEVVLDNQIGLVIDAKRIRHYRPIYSVNEQGWWRYKP